MDTELRRLLSAMQEPDGVSMEATDPIEELGEVRGADLPGSRSIAELAGETKKQEENRKYRERRAAKEAAREKERAARAEEQRRYREEWDRDFERRRAELSRPAPAPRTFHLDRLVSRACVRCGSRDLFGAEVVYTEGSASQSEGMYVICARCCRGLQNKADTYLSESPAPERTGWQCPGCGLYWSPSTPGCRKCNPGTRLEGG